jgi:hypothetical protein
MPYAPVVPSACTLCALLGGGGGSADRPGDGRRGMWGSVAVAGERRLASTLTSVELSSPKDVLPPFLIVEILAGLIEQHALRRCPPDRLPGVGAGARKELEHPCFGRQAGA